MNYLLGQLGVRVVRPLNVKSVSVSPGVSAGVQIGADQTPSVGGLLEFVGYLARRHAITGDLLSKFSATNRLRCFRSRHNDIRRATANCSTAVFRRRRRPSTLFSVVETVSLRGATHHDVLKNDPLQVALMSTCCQAAPPVA